MAWSVSIFSRVPFLDVFLLVVFELRDVLDAALQDGAFVFVAAGDDFGELVDAFVDGFAAPSLD